MYDVKNKTVMITGAGTGLGYKYAEILLRNGAKCVAVIDLPKSNGQRAVATLENEFGKGRAVFFSCDVTKADDLKTTFEKVVEGFGGLDVIINNAGMLDDTRWEYMLDLNVKSLINGSILAMDYMGKHRGGKGGVIVNIASIVGLYPAYFLPMYSASKHAVLGFSQSLARVYEKSGVRVVTMCPGVTATELVANMSNKIHDFMKHLIVDDALTSYPKQETDNVARAMLDLIQKGKNGTVWVSEGGQPPYAVDFTHYSKRSLPI